VIGKRSYLKGGAVDSKFTGGKGGRFYMVALFRKLAMWNTGIIQLFHTK
jgi:hypothetical protein